MKMPQIIASGLLAVLPALAAAAEPKIHTPPRPARTRTFDFTYAVVVTGLEPGKAARIWLPVPSSAADQDVQILSREAPGESRLTRDPVYGNRILHVEARASDRGEIPVKVVYRVLRREVLGAGGKGPRPEAEPLARFLEPDALVPLQGKPLELLRDRTLPEGELAQARLLYDVVNGHMRYSKEGKEWGRGDAVWACDSGFGNCTDFHSLFISLARARKIPARFEIGFSLPEKRGKGEISGYHCWAKFYLKGKGWVPVDISEADKHPAKTDYYFGNLTEDRVAFSTGRDISLSPRQAGKPLNFFIHPHVEVDGAVYPQEKIQRSLSYEDVGK